MKSIYIPFSLAVIPTSRKSVIFLRNCGGVHSADPADSASMLKVELFIRREP